MSEGYILKKLLGRFFKQFIIVFKDIKKAYRVVLNNIRKYNTDILLYIIDHGPWVGRVAHLNQISA